MSTPIVGWESEECGTLCPDCVAYELVQGGFVMHPEGLAEDVKQGELYQPLYRGHAEDFAHFTAFCEGCEVVVSTYVGAN